MPALSEARRFFIASGCPIATTTLYRCEHLRDQLQRLGHEAHVAEWFRDSDIDPNDAQNADIVILYRLEMSDRLERVIRGAREAGKPVVFDTDDLIFEPGLLGWHRAVEKLSAAEKQQHARGVQRYLDTLLASDAVMVATPKLAELVRKRGKPAFVHRNALDDEMLALANELVDVRSPRGDRDGIVIGYGSGTATHDVDFREAASALAHVLREFPQVELWIAGPLEVSAELEQMRDRVRRFPLTGWREWFQLASEFDISIAPLERDNVFCCAKSEIKFVEAGALAVPTIATRIGSFQEAIRDGSDGLLVDGSDEWQRALRLLITDRERRSAIGKAARKSVLARYTTDVRARELQTVLQQILR